MAFPTDYSAVTDNVDTIAAAHINNLETTLKLATERAKFLVKVGAQIDNQTGAGTDYTVAFNTEIVDTAAAFATPNFTAPVSGQYLLTWNIGLRGLAAGNTILQVTIVTSNRTYTPLKIDPHNIIYSTEYFIAGGALQADMDAADTAHLNVMASGTGDAVDVMADYTRFGGALII